MTKHLQARAIYSWHLLIFGILSIAMGAVLWAITRGILTAILGQYGLPATATTVAFWIVPWFLFSLSLALTKIEIDDTGLTIRGPISTIHLEYDNVRSFSSSLGGHVVYLGVPSWGPRGYWIVLTSGEALVKALKKHAPARPVDVKEGGSWGDIAVLFLPILFLALLVRLMIHLSIRPHPLLHASLWGCVSGLTMFYFAFRRPKLVRFGKLGRLGSSVALGLFIGSPLFFFTLFLSL